jgi:hypothetical protein
MLPGAAADKALPIQVPVSTKTAVCFYSTYRTLHIGRPAQLQFGANVDAHTPPPFITQLPSSSVDEM